MVYRILQSKEYSEEVIQDVFVKIWNSIHLYNPEKGRLYTWMINIARNTSLDFLKSKSHQNQLKNQPFTDFVNNDEKFSVSNRNSEFIGFNKLLEKLDNDQQKIINLSYYQGFTQQEISENLGMPLGTVKTKLRNALINLKNWLKDFQ